MVASSARACSRLFLARVGGATCSRQSINGGNMKDGPIIEHVADVVPLHRARTVPSPHPAHIIKCPHCKSLDLVYDTFERECSEMTCTNCGWHGDERNAR